MEKMTETVLDVNSMPTHVIHFGLKSKVLGRDADALENIPHVVVFIPGNPGILQCYLYFVDRIYRKLGLPLIAVSHVGHTKGLKIPDAEENRHHFTLKGQIEHKKAFIAAFIPKETQITFVGHSIGSYIILNLLQDLESSRKINKCILVFPVIERVALTPNSSFYLPLFQKLRRQILWTTFASSYLGENIQSMGLSWYLRKWPDCPDCCLKGALHLFSHEVAHSIIEMYFSTVDQVQDLDKQLLQNNLGRVVLFYGDQDYWCPINYFEELKNSFPEGDFRLDLKGIEHSFVMCQKSTEFIAELVSDCVGTGP